MTSIQPIRSCATDTSTTWCCSTSTSTTRPSSRHSSSSGTALFAGGALRCPRGSLRDRPAAAACFDFPVERSRSALMIDRPLTTTSATGHLVELAPFWIDEHPVTNGDFVIFIAGRWLLSPGATGPRPDGSGSPSQGRRRPCTGAGCDGSWVTRSMDRYRAGAGIASGLSRVVLRSRGVCPLCRKAAPDRVRVGGGRLLGLRVRHQA